MNYYEDFIVVLSELTKVFVNLLRVEERKLTAALENNIELLQSCMAKEQAASLELKGLERKRMQIQTALGFEGLSFQEMIEQSESDYAFELNNAVRLLSDSIKDFEAVADEAGTVIEMNLANLDMLLSQRYMDGHAGHKGNTSGGKFRNLKV